jgi:hypothetical protein
MITKLVKDPLSHFMGAGLLLFLAYGWLTPDLPGDDEILISDATLLEFIQFRSRQFDEIRAREKLATMPEDERQRMIADFIREEALYREALALGLNEGDYILKRRLVQKMEYLVAGSASEPQAPGDAALQAYLNKHAARYTKPARYTFTHIFFSGGNASEQAQQLLAQFSSDAPTFDAAGQYGDLFPYHRNYVDRPADYIASQFGADWPKYLNRIDTGKWQGPYASELGQHLILLTERVEGGKPPLADIRAALMRDYASDQSRQKQEAAVQDLIKRYVIRYEGVNP